MFWRLGVRPKLLRLGSDPAETCAALAQAVAVRPFDRMTWTLCKAEFDESPYPVISCHYLCGANRLSLAVYRQPCENDPGLKLVANLKLNRKAWWEPCGIPNQLIAVALQLLKDAQEKL